MVNGIKIFGYQFFQTLVLNVQSMTIRLNVEGILHFSYLVDRTFSTFDHTDHIVALQSAAALIQHTFPVTELLNLLIILIQCVCQHFLQRASQRWKFPLCGGCKVSNFTCTKIFFKLGGRRYATNGGSLMALLRP